MEQIATIAVGRNPIQLFITPDGRYIYVANQGSEVDPDNTVSVIETANNSVIATIETGKGAHGVVASDDGKRTFVANSVDDTVSVINTTTSGRGGRQLSLASRRADHPAPSKSLQSDEGS